MGEVDKHPGDQCCGSLHCKGNVFAACIRCQTLMCFEHFDKGEECKFHAQFERENPPESFVIEESVGNDINPLLDTSQNVPVKTPKSKNRLVKDARNKGKSYFSEKSDKFVGGRKFVEYNKCDLSRNHKKVSCGIFTEEDRREIRYDYYGMGNLALQREWIARHVSHKAHSHVKSRKKQTMRYTLPRPSSFSYPGEIVTVCRKMFLNTLGIAERQVRTVLGKTKSGTGVLGRERRGGTQKPQIQKRQKIIEHLQCFPRVESHYCRSSTTCQYLSGELTKRRMFNMFENENPGCASYSLYKEVMRELKLKFHRPKKDKCGICETFRKSNEVERDQIKVKYNMHRQEISKVRQIKSESKTRAQHDDKHAAAVFDLQQNMYLPKSNRGELFYKRRLACYNFTIYNLANHAGSCYLSNETVTRRGACEVSTYVLDYLSNCDKEGKTSVDFFCDGCVGQNKNSIVPSMVHRFVSEAKSVQVVTFYYFETNHGQSEGDSMHSTIEKCLARSEEVFHPCQLSSIIKEARKDPCPYTVRHVQTNDILDWKTYGHNLGILKCRQADTGEAIDWTTFKQIRISKELPTSILFKTSHNTNDFSILSLGRSRSLRSTTPAVHIDPPSQLYQSRPKLSAGKYSDLVSLCRGTYPVISQPELVDYYINLPHE